MRQLVYFLIFLLERESDMLEARRRRHGKILVR
jgi:hypothetical protein